MAGRPSADVTDTELAILQVLWDRGTATRRDITSILYPGGGDAHYATVQNLLGRLERKRFVSSTRDGKVLYFGATVEKDELIRRRIQNLADKLCDGAIVPLVMTLMRSQRFSADEVEQLDSF